MNTIKKIFLGLFVLTINPLWATKLILKTSSSKPICIYINDVNERCVTQSSPNSIEIKPTMVNKIFAVDETGTISSSFYTIAMPKEAKTIEINVELSKNEIALKPSNQETKLIPIKD